MLPSLPIRRHSHGPFMDRVWALRANLTAYDASYVALAEALAAVVVTGDARLARAPGHSACIEVID
jgi:predicted nucleic acid-binding protein